MAVGATEIETPSMSAAFRLVHVAFMVQALAAFGCGSSQVGSDPGPAYSEGGYAARHPELPRVVSQGGRVLTSPVVVPITFQPDPLAAQIDLFVSQLAASQYWTDATAEYGVGRLTARAPLELTGGFSAAFTDDDVKSWLRAQITSTSHFPQPTDQTIYALIASGYFATSSDGNTSASHSDFTLPDGRTVVYAVVTNGSGSLDEVTGNLSHEIAEAATDPRPLDGPAFSYLDADDKAWEQLGNRNGGLGLGEVGDICEVVAAEGSLVYSFNALPQTPPVMASGPGVLVDTPGVDSKVQRLWSNRAAAASHDPCEPLGLKPYFNSAPVLGDIVMATDPAGHAFSTRGVHIAVGDTRTVELDLFSDSPTAPWTLVGSDNAGFSCGPNPGVAFIGGLLLPSAPTADRLEVGRPRSWCLAHRQPRALRTRSTALKERTATRSTSRSG